MSKRRVGKIVSRGLAAWARRAHDFAHAEGPSGAPLPALRFGADEVIE